MRIGFEEATVCIRWQCIICGGRTDKEDVQPILQDAEGEGFGFVCRRCFHAGPALMIDTMRHHLTWLRHNPWVHPNDLRCLEQAAELAVNEGIQCPSAAEWDQAIERCEEKFMCDGDRAPAVDRRGAETSVSAS